MVSSTEAAAAVRAPVRARPAWLSRVHFSRYGLLLVTGYAASIVLFGLVAELKGADAFSVLKTIWQTLTNSDSLQQSLLRAVPVAMAALAVALPARAGLVNVGGEGQLIIGAVAAAGTGVAIGAHVPGIVSWILMGMAGAGAGAVWAGLSGVLRTVLGASEAVTSLLLNFLANDVMLYLLYQSWKDPNGGGQPQSKPLPHDAVLPKLFGSQLNLGVLIALAATVLAWWLLQRTSWGFALRAVGGNREAARRAGLKVNGLLLSSMLVGGAFAGLGGALNLAGVETILRPNTTLTYGYIGFLASFLGRGNPAKAVLAAAVFSGIALSGNWLQINDGLDGAIVDILLALVVAAPLVVAKYRRQS
jgi:simple sugar transport system permease protein